MNEDLKDVLTVGGIAAGTIGAGRLISRAPAVKALRSNWAEHADAARNLRFFSNTLKAGKGNPEGKRIRKLLTDQGKVALASVNQEENLEMGQREEYILNALNDSLEKQGHYNVSRADYVMEKHAGWASLIAKGGRKALELGKKGWKKLKEATKPVDRTPHPDSLPGSYYSISQRVARERRY